MITSIFLLTVVMSSGNIQQPAFLVVNQSNGAQHKAIENDAVIAFAQTPQGRVLFSPYGAFVGIPNGLDSVAVLQVGFSPRQHKQGLQPRMGKAQATRVHHFHGSPNTWQKNMTVPQDLTYRKVWPGIDLTFLTRGSQLEFQLQLAPGADVADIALTTGAQHLRVVDGFLVATLQGAELRLSPPQAFQTQDGKNTAVPVRYEILADGAFGFSLAAYDTSRPLLIDPVLSWSTFFGGSGTDGESERAVVVTLNDANEAIVGGETKAPDFPVTPGAFSTELNGDRDIFVGKLSADGTTFSFITLIGSNGDDRIYDIDIDDDENIYITGEVRGPDFPTTPGAYARTRNNDSAYVTKLNATGSALVFSTYLGGSGSDEGSSLLVEPGGTVLAVMEANSTDLPTTIGAPGPTQNGSQDVYIARLSADGSQVLFGSYFGGSGLDAVSDAIRLSDGRVMITGDTSSSDLPTTPGAFNESFNGNRDWYIAILAADNASYSTVTYLGGTNQDSVVGLGMDSSGNVFVGGYTTSSDFPTTAGAFDETFNGDRDGVIAKLSPDLATLLAATYLGGTDREFIRTMDVDGSGQPIALGTTRGPDFPTTAGALAETLNGGQDMFATKLNSDLTALSFSTFIGGSESDSASGMALDNTGNIYGVGSTESSNFPFTIGTPNGTRDSILFKLSMNGSNLVYAHIFGGGGGDSPGEAIRTATGGILIVGRTGTTSFPVTPGVFDDTIIGNDAFISQLDASGSTLVFSTFLGGSGNENAATVALDGSGQILVSGNTSSADFPVTPGSFDETLDGDDDIFIAKFSSTGSALTFATFLGGTSFDEARGMALAADGSIFLTGTARSTDFPVTMGAFDETLNGSGDAFVCKLSADGTALTYSTFLGTSNFDSAAGIAVDALGQAIVTGFTNSGFPTTPGAFDETHNGSTDAFVTQFNAAGDALVFSTYLGSTNSEEGWDVLVEPNGVIHICGAAKNGFPTTAGAFQETNAGSNDGFVSTLSPDGTQLLFSTYLGGTGSEIASQIDMDHNGHLVVAGVTQSSDFPTTANAPQDFRYDEDDVFLSMFGCNGAQLQFSTYWGHEDDDSVSALAGDGGGLFTIFGATEAASFPTTAGVFDTDFTGTEELFLSEFDLRSEQLFLTNQSSAVQGLATISLEALLPGCATDPLDVQWFNETAGTMFPLNTNPVNLSPTPVQSLTMRVDVTDSMTANTASRRVLVLVSQNPQYFDLNGDGCNDFADIHTMAPTWMTAVAGDPNDDGIIDVRDFLYVNTEQEGNCPIQ